jgi:uncharacterized protein with PIN domain
MYHDFLGREIEDAEMDNMRRDSKEEQEGRMMITGHLIHQAFCAVEPEQARSWDAISLVAQQKYDAMAEELNKMLTEDAVTIAEVRCPHCKDMLSDLKGHPCLLS